MSLAEFTSSTVRGCHSVSIVEAGGRGGGGGGCGGGDPHCFCIIAGRGGGGAGR